MSSAKKVLYIVNSWENGAIPNILLDISPFLKQNGWDISFLTLEAIPESHLSVRRCRDAGYPLETLGLEPKQVLISVAALKQKIRAVTPDLIHTHLGRADIFTPWAKGAIPQITTFHSVKQNYNRFTLLGYRLSDRKISYRTGVSQASIDSFYRDRFLKGPHEVVYNPVNAQRLIPHRNREQLFSELELPNTRETKLVVAVGRLIPVKAHSRLIEAISALRETFPGLRCVIAGDGPLKDELEVQIRERSLEGIVVLVGAWENVADLYANADALVFPSLWEGLGLVPLEALLLECPVASSSIPAVQEFLVAGENALLFEPDSSASMANAIEEILRFPDDAQQRAKKGKQMVLQRFAPEVIAAQYERIYKKVIGRS